MSLRVMTAVWILSGVFTVGLFIHWYQESDLRVPVATNTSPVVSTSQSSCPQLVLSTPDLQKEIRETLRDHNTAMMAGDLAEDGYAQAARRLIDVATRCWHFTLEDLMVTHDDLRVIGMEKPQAQKGEAPASPFICFVRVK